eukprot:9248328-Pyramimonas_sp.AAC.1
MKPSIEVPNRPVGGGSYLNNRNRVEADGSGVLHHGQKVCQHSRLRGHTNWHHVSMTQSSPNNMISCMMWRSHDLLKTGPLFGEEEGFNVNPKNGHRHRIFRD